MKNSLLSLMFPFHGLDELVDKNASATMMPEWEKQEREISLAKSTIVFTEDKICQSLLFQACLSMAMAKREVVYITREQFSSLPFMISNMPQPNAESLSLIKFKYFKSSREIIDYLASIHLETKLPSLIVIENLMSFLECQENEPEIDSIRAACMICAHLKSASDFINSKLFCATIVSCKWTEKAQCLKLYSDSYLNLKSTSVKDFEMVYSLTTRFNQDIRLKFSIVNNLICLREFSSSGKGLL